jgi:glycosyltransferase involved in cell wall biosynthesis
LLQLVRRADVLHIAGPALFPIVLGLLARKPVVIEHHGFQVICPTGQMLIESRGEPCPGHFMAGHRAECWDCDPKLGWFASRKLWLLTFARRFLCKRASANIMPTSWLRDQLGLPRAATIHHGLVGIEPAPNTEVKPSRPPVIAFQGRLVTTKGARVLLKAATILCEQKRDFEILFIGDGPERDHLESLAKQRPLLGRVRFTGRLAPAELEAALREASTLVVPSLGGEVFGMVVAENMQRGLPVIASDLGAFVEVLGPAGRTFRAGDPLALADELARLLDNPAHAAQLAQLGRNRVKDLFILSNMIGQHALLYRKLLTAKDI